MLRGVVLKIGATLAFALMAVLIKAAAPTYPVGEIVFFRSVFAMASSPPGSRGSASGLRP